MLQYQNQKLVQKLEVQKVEHTALENKFCQLKEKQQPYDETLEAVNEAWEQVVHLCFLLLLLFSNLSSCLKFELIQLSRQFGLLLDGNLIPMLCNRW